MNTVRLGIIGMGNIGKYHAAYLLEGKVPRAELVAVADALAPLETFAARGLKTYAAGEALLRSGAVDAVIIATPHYQHTTLGIAAFQAGRHVLVEKPISVHKADAERLIAARRERPELVFGAMFQLRTEPRYVRIKQLIARGELGKLVRASWIITDWFRTEAYYASGGWRATWQGEGGGVLLNQCPHNLDLLQWFCGLPARVRGFCQLGRYHRIEVEDNVTAYWEWADGATGVFITSTGEAPARTAWSSAAPATGSPSSSNDNARPSPTNPARSANRMIPSQSAITPMSVKEIFTTAVLAMLGSKKLASSCTSFTLG